MYVFKTDDAGDTFAINPLKIAEIHGNAQKTTITTEKGAIYELHISFQTVCTQINNCMAGKPQD